MDIKTELNLKNGTKLTIERCEDTGDITLSSDGAIEISKPELVDLIDQLNLVSMSRLRYA